MWREKARGDVLALGLVLGGALGNILDRVRFGYVVDFADFHIGEWRPFLIFNLADAAITIGVLILLARRSEEHTSELQSLMRISYAVFCLKKKKKHEKTLTTLTDHRH